MVDLGTSATRCMGGLTQERVIMSSVQKHEEATSGECHDDTKDASPVNPGSNCLGIEFLPLLFVLEELCQPKLNLTLIRTLS